MTPRSDASTIYEAAAEWKNRCLIGDGSVFLADEPIWTIKNLKRFRTAFTENPLQGPDDFLTKLQQQLLNQPAPVKLLAAEMLWILLLYPRRTVSPQRKRELVTALWSEFSTQPLRHEYLLSDHILGGVGNAGTSFNTNRDRELEALIDITLALKHQRPSFDQPEEVAKVIDELRKAGRRNVRNILLHLLYPIEFERIASLQHKREIVNAFSELTGVEWDQNDRSPLAVDRQLSIVRAGLEARTPGKEIDFFDRDLLALWRSPKKDRTIKSVPAGVDEVVRGTPLQADRSRDDDEGKPIYNGPNLNDYASAGVWEAYRLAKSAQLHEPEPDLLFAAYLLLAGHPTLGSRSAMALDRRIAEVMYARRPSGDPSVDFILERYGLPSLPVFDGLPKVAPGGRIKRILSAAERIRAAVAKDETSAVSTRHILAVLLSKGPHSVTALLEQFHLDPRDLRSVMFSMIEASRYDESIIEWRRILLNMQSATEDEASSVYAGFSSDALASGGATGLTRADDQLDIMSDVTALCEIIAALATRPPLAIGLFGDWGTGKSFFMELMRQEVRSLGEQNSSFYCSRAVQVWFNAWHYMDNNLWASLATRVFEALAEQLEAWKEPTDRQQALFIKLQESRGVLAEAVEQKADAHVRLEAIRKERADKQKSVVEAAGLAFEAAVGTLKCDADVQKKLRDVSARLGLSDERLQLNNTRAQLREFKSLAARLAAIPSAIKHAPRFIVLGLLIFAAVFGSTWWLLDNFALFTGTARIVSQLIGTLAGLVLALAPIRHRVSQAVHWLEDVSTRLHQKQESYRRQEELSLQLDILRLNEREREAQAELDELVRDIEGMRTGRRLERFIMERHTSAEYRQQLGIVSLIRNDFQQLSALLSESANDRAKAASTAAAKDSTDSFDDAPAEELPRIDRIVLYIDDLDRCPEHRVVEVLQAVHLLLGFPLFVVVVGVDSRWLLLSLEDHYAALRGLEARREDSSEEEWSTTPQNYLEKIFQIPFSLRPMAPTGFGNLVDSLLPLGNKPDSATDETFGTPVYTESSEKLGRIENVDLDSEVDDDVPETDHQLTSFDGEGSGERLNPQGLTVEAWEREFIRKLHPLIASPRALKRFTNIYRLIRVQQRGADLDRFRGTDAQPGEFQVLAILLAALVGFPAEATTLLHQTIRPPSGPWWDLVRGLNSAGGSISDAATSTSRPNREHRRLTMQQALLEVKGTVGTHPPETYARWARVAARFSFQSGRILSYGDEALTRESASPEC